MRNFKNKYITWAVKKRGFSRNIDESTLLKGKNGDSIRVKVVVVIQKDKGRMTYKMVTVYPGKKE